MRKIFTFLLALVTSVGLSYAQSGGISVTQFTIPSEWKDEGTELLASDLPGFGAADPYTTQRWNEVPSTGFVYLIYAFESDGRVKYHTFEDGVRYSSPTEIIEKNEIYYSGATIYYTTGPSNWGPEELPQVSEITNPPSEWYQDHTDISTTEMPGFVTVDDEIVKAWDAAPQGAVNLISSVGSEFKYHNFLDGVYQYTVDHSLTRNNVYYNIAKANVPVRFFYTTGTIPGGSTPAPANSCGDGLTWELNAGVFTISYDGVGTGVMDDFDYSEHPAPWQSSKESITSVIIPDGVTRIGNNAFSGAYNLASVSMGNDVVAIGNNAFEACNSLSSITLSSHVTTIGDHAFAGLQSLTSIVLPSTVQSIGTSAFYGNEGLTSITCEGTTPPTLGQYVFGMIGNGATLYVPYGYAETYESADSQWQALNIQVIGSGSASYPYCGDGLTWTYNDGVLTIIYDGVGTGDMLDYGNYNIVPWDSYKDDITSVIIPDGVTRIGNYAFANLTNLASVSMGDDVVEIGYGGFWNCLLLQSITLGSHVTTIGEHAFGSNHALTSITLPNTLQTIGGSAFYDCRSLPTITIPSSVTSFGEYAFGMCEGLTSFTCEGTTPPTLGQDVFTMVPYHRPLYVPDGYVETYQGADSQWQKFDISIIPAPTPKPSWVRDGDDWDDATKTLTVNSNPGKQAYQSITEIQHVVINNSVTSMDSEVFRYCTGLTSVTIPNSVTSIGYQVFSGCTGLTSVTIPNGITSIPSSLFYNCSSLSDVTIPNSVTSIGNSAFRGCTGLTSVTIPNSVTSIDMQAFNGCTGLTSVTIPNSVTSIEYFAFDGCTNVTDVYCYPLAADLTWNLANNSFKANKATQCHVFASELSAYQDKFASVRVTFVGDLPAPASHPHGECGAQGDNLLWDLDPSTGVLTITGSGAMADWTYDTDRPWYSLRAQITSVVLPSGITTLGKYAFRGTDIVSINMTENYPAGLTAINQEAFFSTQLTSVTIPESVVTIGMDAFRQSLNIENVYCYADPNNLTWNDYYCDDFKNADHATVCHVKACALSTYEANWGGTPYNVYNSTGVNVTFVGDLPGDCGASTPTDEQVATNADPENPSYHYSTFFHSTQNYKLSNDGTQAFIADLSNNELVLTEIAHGEQVIPANTAVILRKAGSADPVVLVPTEENGVSVNPDDNSLEGVDVATPVADIAGLTVDNCYVLSGTVQYGVGFYKINGNTLKAHKAYVKFTGGPNNAPKKMRFVFNQEQTATGVESIQSSAISGQKLIENGQLIIIKNGVRYNAQGQIVK